MIQGFFAFNFFLVLVFLPIYISEEPVFVKEDNIGFATNHKVMVEKDVQFFCILLDEQLHPLYQSGKGKFSFEKDAKPLDIYNYWGQARK